MSTTYSENTEDLENGIMNTADEVILDVTKFYSKEQITVEIISYLITSVLLILLFGIGLIFLVFTGLVYLRLRFIFEHRKCYITNTSIVLKEDIPWLFVFFPYHQEKTIQIQKITDITLSQSPLQKYFDLWSIKIETPSNNYDKNGVSTSDLLLSGIKERSKADKIKKLLTSHVNGKPLSNYDSISMEEHISHPVSVTLDSSTVKLLEDIRDSLKRLENKKT